MLFVATPIVQFKKIGQFLADIDNGHVVGVWHECFARRSGEPPRYDTIIRALVVEEGVVPTARIASFIYRHPLLVDAEKGRVTDEERLWEHGRREHERVVDDLRGRLAEMGILEGKLRPGLLSVPSTYQYVDTMAYDY